MAKNTFLELAEKLRAKIPHENVPAIAESVGISERWVRYFRDGKIPNPGILTLDALERALKKGKK